MCSERHTRLVQVASGRDKATVDCGEAGRVQTVAHHLPEREQQRDVTVRDGARGVERQSQAAGLPCPADTL
jgi:hypothetical protein